MIEGMVALLLCQAVGTALADALHLPLPGPVVGMLLMLGHLAWRRPADDAPVLRAGDALLGIMPLLFVPAGVGVITWLGVLRAAWLPIGVGMVLPWAVGLLVAAATAGLAMRGRRPASDVEGAEALIHEVEEIEGVDPVAGR